MSVVATNGRPAADVMPTGPCPEAAVTCLCIIGTRPEAIKMAPVVRALKGHAHRIVPVICSTGQHREMLDQVLALFDITPDFELNVMRPDQALAAVTSRLLNGIDGVIGNVRPHCVLAQGDTTTVLAAALAAYY